MCVLYYRYEREREGDCCTRCYISLENSYVSPITNFVLSLRVYSFTANGKIEMKLCVN